MLQSVPQTLVSLPVEQVGSPEAGPQISLLAGSVMLLMFDVDTRVWSAGRLEPACGPALAPLAALRLQREDGGTRLLFAFRRPAQMQTLSLFAGRVGQSVEVALDPVDDFSPTEPERLLAGLTPAAQVSLMTTFLETWPSIFRMRTSRRFVALLHRLVRASAPVEPPLVRAVARLDAATALIEGGLPMGCDAIGTLYCVSPDGMRRISGAPRYGAPGARGQRRFYLALETAGIGADTFIVLTGPNWFAVRRIEMPGDLASLTRWWRSLGKPDPVLREHAVALASSGAPAAQAAAVEMQLQCPLPPRALSGGPHLPSADIDLALATDRGMLVGGWLRDPLGMVTGIDLLAGDAALPLGAVQHTFSGIVGKGDDATAVTGFCALVAADVAVPMLQPRFGVALKSGERHVLVPPPQPVDVAERRSRALKAIPPQFLTGDAIARCLAPALAAIHGELMATQGAPRVVTLGTRLKAPRVSIVVPLYRVLDFLRVQVGAFAADGFVREACEIIYVLDSPKQADGLEHLLRGLHLLYDLPLVLVVMARNAGFAAASNAGAREARGDVVAQVNSDVIPTAAGWLSPLLAALEGEEFGAVGPKLLFDDGSLQHAGMYFAPGPRGQWLNHHFHKGMPRHYPPATVARNVPAVTGACLLMRRTLFEEVGGFTEDYVIGDYEDSDLCLKVRAKGFEVGYVPQAELYHLERRSMSVNADHARGAASAYNAWLHAQRWGDVMATLMTPDAALSASGQLEAECAA